MGHHAQGRKLKMEEEVVESIPTETTDSDEDFFADVDETVAEEDLAEEQTSIEETEEPQQPTETTEETKKEEVDFKPLLDALKGKIKYNKEEVNVESIDDLISNYQKGLNYDKKLQELENLQNSKLEKYAKSKAEELGITVDEYMDQVEAYEREQERAKERERIEQMVNDGVPEDVAKEVIAAGQMRKEYQKRENELKKREEALNQEEAKKKEYQNFLDSFPDVNPDDIPKEVFEEAEKSSLSDAYMKWKLKDLQNQLDIAKTNEKNAKASVGGLTDTGPANEKHEKDPFLEGFLE